MDGVLNLPTCPVPVLTPYRSYRRVRYRYWRCTELTEVSGTGTKVCTGTAGTGIDVVRNLPKCPVPRTELTGASGTGTTVCTGTGTGAGTHVNTYTGSTGHKYRGEVPTHIWP